MSGETIKVKLWQVRETPRAYLFSTTEFKNRDTHHIWIPRSQIEHITREPRQYADEWQVCVVTLPLWLAETKGIA